MSKNSRFFDLCCGAGSVFLEMINSGVPQNRVVVADIAPIGAVWELIGNGQFDIDYFSKLIDSIPNERELIKEYLENLSKEPIDFNYPYPYLLLQAGSFGSKQIWINNGKWKNLSFRNYWMPTQESKRRSPVNPMMPMPKTLLDRMSILSNKLIGLKAYNRDIFSIIEDIKEEDIVYVDPPYQDSTGYMKDFDIVELVDKLRGRAKKVFISEGKKILDKAVLISSPRLKGGISGKRKTSVEEWLNILEK